MPEALQYHRILLIRGHPGGASSRQAQARAEACREEGNRLLLFFHGEGVGHAARGAPSAPWRRLAERHDVVLAACSGSWSRRHEQAPADPFVLSSLVSFWHHALDAGRVECFGADHGR